MKKKPNRIIILCAALICTGLGGCLMSWSYFRDALGQLFPAWSQSQLSLPFAFHNITVCVMMIATGQILRKLSSRVVLGIGALTLMVGFGLFRLLPVDNPGGALIMATVSFGVISAIAVGVGVIVGFDTFLPWFPDRPGMVSGILSFFIGIVPILLGALCGVFIRNFGVLQAVPLIGLIPAVLVFISLIWVKQPGPDTLLPPPPPIADTFIGVDYSPMEMLKTGTFWLMFIYNVLLRSAALIVFDLGGTLAIAFGAATIFGLLFAPLNGAACILGGFILDKVSAHKVMLVFGIFAAIGGAFLLLGNAAGSAVMIILGISFIGFSYGGVTVTSISGTRILFGAKHYAHNLGLIFVSIGPAAVACMTAGKLISSGGSFTGVFSLIFTLSVVAVISCLLMFITERSRKKKLSLQKHS